MYTLKFPVFLWIHTEYRNSLTPMPGRLSTRERAFSTVIPDLKIIKSELLWPLPLFPRAWLQAIISHRNVDKLKILAPNIVGTWNFSEKKIERKFTKTLERVSRKAGLCDRLCGRHPLNTALAERLPASEPLDPGLGQTPQSLAKLQEVKSQAV